MKPAQTGSVAAGHLTKRPPSQDQQLTLSTLCVRDDDSTQDLEDSFDITSLHAQSALLEIMLRQNKRRTVEVIATLHQVTAVEAASEGYLKIVDAIDGKHKAWQLEYMLPPLQSIRWTPASAAPEPSPSGELHLSVTTTPSSSVSSTRFAAAADVRSSPHSSWLRSIPGVEDSTEFCKIADELMELPSFGPSWPSHFAKMFTTDMRLNLRLIRRLKVLAELGHEVKTVSVAAKSLYQFRIGRGYIPLPGFPRNGSRWMEVGDLDYLLKDEDFMSKKTLQFYEIE